MSKLFSRLWAAWRRQSRHFVGEDLEGNRYYEIPTKRTDLIRPTRRVEYGRISHDVAQNANRARQLSVQWTSWLSHTRPDPPSMQELQADLLRRQRLQHNVRMIEARDREERERQTLAVQTEPQHLRIAEESVESSTQNSNGQERPKNVEDPWEKAKKEAPPEKPTSWQPQIARRR
ncbi:hypothetical protein RSOLAG1IB_02206 [Rhizoctonia solani AG-1 IB]|uniref:NADH dehydrogenase [ubiquinone] 1 alpha subcomplex subunit n=1 Tax=Thanatephorus cucumeris (strain AG1-IB / isolate 7/3/14) TaxID=1108050 RepID=A0A0B7FHJ6_THACB|nr:hypothetical protein RSOLAG1IB_02206 [Rhizoctonia solani AG-1 IB]